jgi:nucleotide-binding universal stress UspA family protein
MSAKIIISYDGTANEEDAIALGRIFGQSGAQLAVAYVTHGHDSPGDTQGLLNRGLELLGDAHATGHVVNDPSTPDGLATLADSEGADAIVFCSDSHTANGHVSIGNSAQRLLSGGHAAIAIAPVGLAERTEGIRNVVVVGDGDGGARETAASLAGAVGAELAPVANADTDLLVIDSRAEGEQGRVSLSSSAEHLIEVSSCAVLVLPRGVRLEFGAAARTVA